MQKTMTKNVHPASLQGIDFRKQPKNVCIDVEVRTGGNYENPFYGVVCTCEKVFYYGKRTNIKSNWICTTTARMLMTQSAGFQGIPTPLLSFLLRNGE